MMSVQPMLTIAPIMHCEGHAKLVPTSRQKMAPAAESSFHPSIFQPVSPMWVQRNVIQVYIYF